MEKKIEDLRDKPLEYKRGFEDGQAYVAANEDQILIDLKEVVKEKKKAVSNNNWLTAANIKNMEDELLNRLPLIEKLKEIGITTL